MLFKRGASHVIFLNTNRYLSSKESVRWKSVVGLEVHAQINTDTKLFSGASTKFSSPVNANVSHFDCSIPGTLPVLNKKCVEFGVITALALNCKVNAVSMFDRKHYFYADIPTGYQITQQRHPLANDGHLEFQVYTPGIHKSPYSKKVRIKQLQLEQDSGKSLHDSDRSLIDLNRAGVPLMELVFEPDLTDGEEAAALVKELATILYRIGTCTCKMEEGALRVDANVSIHQKGEPLGTRTEIKNIGSVRGVASAVQYEIERQVKIKKNNGVVINETRAWDALGKKTVAMRDKEQMQDYRYMPEPNLPPLHIAMGPVKQGCVNADDLRKSIPELPEQTRTRLREYNGLTLEQSIFLVNESYLLKLFEVVKRRNIEGKFVANFIINDYLTLLHKCKLEPNEFTINSTYFGDVVEYTENKTITRNTAKLVLKKILEGNTKLPIQIIKDNNWLQITDEEELTQLCEKVLKENEPLHQQYKKGKTKLFKAFMGLIASGSNGKADMEKCSKILKKLLEEK